MFAKKICPKNEKIIHFCKALDHAISKMQILNNLIFDQENLKMCKFHLTGCLQKLQFFLAKLVQFVSLCQRLSKKLNLIKI